MKSIQLVVNQEYDDGLESRFHSLALGIDSSLRIRCSWETLTLRLSDIYLHELCYNSTVR